MNISILGGGNIGMQFAVHSAKCGNRVTLYTSKANQFYNELRIINKNNITINSAVIDVITNDIKEAVKNADLLFITYPAFKMDYIANEIYSYIKQNTYIGIIPGTGGGEFSFAKFIEKNCIIFGIQRVPSVARIVEPGKSVCCEGYRKELFCASLIADYTHSCCNILNNIFNIPVIALPNYINISLTPSNPILHTSRLYSIFKNYKQNTFYDKLPLFYEDWSDEASELLLNCNTECEKLWAKIGENIDTSYLKSLKQHYEISSIKELTKKLRSIESLKGLKTPQLTNNGKLQPDFQSRYFIADFPYGLNIIIQTADLFNIDVPVMKKIWNWYNNISNCKGLNLLDYGIDTNEKYINFYKR